MTAVDKKKVESKTLPAVPELRLKLAKKAARARAVLAKRRVTKTLTVQKRLRENFLRAEKYAKQYASAERREIEKKRSAKREGSYYIPGEARLAFVMRIRGWVKFLIEFFPIISWICPIFSLLDSNWRMRFSLIIDKKSMIKWKYGLEPTNFNHLHWKLCALQFVWNKVRLWFDINMQQQKSNTCTTVLCATDINDADFNGCCFSSAFQYQQSSTKST